MKFTVAPHGSVKVNGEHYLGGDKFEADIEEVSNLLSSGSIVEEGKSAPKQKSTKRTSGKTIKTPSKEGALSSDGEVTELK